MKKLYVIHNINETGKNARTVQVQATISELSQLCQVVSVLSKLSLFGISVSLESMREKSLCRKIIFHSYLLFLFLLKNRNKSMIYSRNLSVCFLLRCMGYRIFYESHDAERGINVYLMRLCIKLGLGVVAISDALKIYLVKEYQLDPRNIVVAHDGVFVEDYSFEVERNAVRMKYDIPTNAFVLMHSGSIFKGRGLDILSKSSNLNNAYFVQVGGSPKDSRNFRRLIGENNKSKIIERVEKSELINLQLAADAFILPMTKESTIWWCTSPMKLFEYMAAKKPILHTGLGSITEILNDNNSYAFNSPDELSVLVDTVKEDLKNGVDVAKEAYNLCVASYTWEKRAQVIFNFIK